MPKRKAPEELSRNPHSLRRRKYEASLNPQQLEVCKAVNNDRAFRGHHTRTVKKSKSYLNAATEEGKENLVKAYVSAK